MKPLPIKIVNQQTVDRVCEIARSLPQDGSHVVEIREYVDAYTARQRALYFDWCDEIGAVTGETKEEVHARLKKDHLSKIYERDDPDGYGATIASVREVWKLGAKKEAKELYAGIIKLTSITDANKKQMSEYMDCIDKECISQRIYLTQPRLYFE